MVRSAACSARSRSECWAITSASARAVPVVASVCALAVWRDAVGGVIACFACGVAQGSRALALRNLPRATMFDCMRSSTLRDGAAESRDLSAAGIGTMRSKKTKQTDFQIINMRMHHGHVVQPYGHVMRPYYNTLQPVLRGALTVCRCARTPPLLRCRVCVTHSPHDGCGFGLNVVAYRSEQFMRCQISWYVPNIT